MDISFIMLLQLPVYLAESKFKLSVYWTFELMKARALFCVCGDLKELNK